MMLMYSIQMEWEKSGTFVEIQTEFNRFQNIKNEKIGQNIYTNS